MREPNLEATIEFLSNAGIDIENMENGNEENAVIDRFFDESGDSVQTFEQLLYFCKKEQASTVVHEIENLGDSPKKQRVISSLVSLYPVSRNIVFKLLNYSDMSQMEFIEAFDFNDSLLKKIRDSLDSVKENSSETDWKFRDYSDEILELEKDIEELREHREEMLDQSDDYKKKKAEKDKLEEEIEKFNKMFNEGGIEKSIKDKQRELEELKEKVKKKMEDAQKLEQELKEIKENIEENGKSEKNKELQNALKVLEKCIKAIEQGKR